MLPPGMPALRVTPMPADANFHGDIFGGWIMSQVDLAGSIPASRRARGRVATVAVNSFQFKQPVLIGDEIVAVLDLKTDRERQKLLVQKWTWIAKDARAPRRKQIEEALHRFERFQLAK